MKKTVQFLTILALIFTFFSCSSTMEDETMEHATKQSSRNSLSNQQKEVFTYNVVSLYRFMKNNKHFYTTNYAEGTSAGYNFEGELGKLYVPKPEYYPNGVMFGNPILRWRHKTTGDRLITNGSDELLPMLYTNSNVFPNNIVYPGSPNGTWIYEGILGYGPSTHVAPITIAIYRYYNPSLNNHLFTANINELGAGGGMGYSPEGFSFALYNN
ncbi:hypothetical protein JI747_003890 [Chryseobacterium sp. RG1]|uniref:DUF5648 domain-containing protein n=1 Tax=Chryseobacterium tagetis TaxID=2801334 RepID=A0ABS7ZX44_9FLAO|nr:hypothetical protein [Chryseobacterium tagetis]MCA6066307.1 hypothetical protein [Chryseobacterium tagetis]